VHVVVIVVVSRRRRPRRCLLRLCARCSSSLTSRLSPTLTFYVRNQTEPRSVVVVAVVVVFFRLGSTFNSPLLRSLALVDLRVDHSPAVVISHLVVVVCRRRRRCLCV